MAYKLILEIYSFQLKKLKAPAQKSATGRWRCKLEKNPSNFIDFVNSLDLQGETMNNYMNVILRSFVSSFEGKFVKTISGTSVSSLTSDPFNGFSSDKFLLWGKFKAGNAGLRFKVYDVNDATQAERDITPNKVPSTEFFFMLWLPKDSNTGMLMIQRYNTFGFVASFRERIDDWFIQKGFKPTWIKYIPQEVLQNYYQNGSINKIEVTYAKRVKRRKFDPLFTPFKSSNKKVVIDGFNIPLIDFINKVNRENAIKDDIKGVVSDFDADKDSVRLFYTNGSSPASAELGDVEDIFPKIVLDDSLLDGNNIPIWNAVLQKAKELLEAIKAEIHYTPANQ
jgi:hypothetical protein